MTFYASLLDQTSQARQTLMQHALINASIEGNISVETYTDFLIQAYHHVKHTGTLLTICRKRLPDQYGWLKTAIDEYLEEDDGHTNLILDDLDACGIDINAVENSTSPETAASRPTEMIVAYAYEMVEKVNPVAIFCLLLILEGIGTEAAKQASATLMHTFDLPKEAFSYLLSDGSIDLGDMEFHEDLLNDISDPDELAMIVHVAERFYQFYGYMLTEIESKAMQRVMEDAA